MTTTEIRSTDPAETPVLTENPVPDAAEKARQTFATRPMTGDEYIESIRDGREIYLHGERVEDITTHPAFRNPIRMTARLYDSMHDPATRAKVTVPTDTGNGGVTMPFFKASKSSADLLAERDAIAEWARMTYGWMGRSPDYK
ncbi:4-hydroxyphenylacetate 3-hydroxylase N-terminal domain-containing protein, partial [Gordonia sp. GN26]